MPTSKSIEFLLITKTYQFEKKCCAFNGPKEDKTYKKTKFYSLCVDISYKMIVIIKMFHDLTGHMSMFHFGTKCHPRLQGLSKLTIDMVFEIKCVQSVKFCKEQNTKL